MKHITLLALDGTIASTVTGPTDIFSLAGVLWNQICGFQPEPYFKVVIASVRGRPVKCVNGIVIQPHLSLDEVKKTDLIIISAEDIAALDATSRHTAPWLLKHHKAGSTLASVCTGAFLLAETGLLNGKRATTHWGFAELFRKRYPQVDLRPESLITDEGSLICGGGAFSYFDLSLYLVEKYCGFEVAAQCGKSLLLDIGRTSQTPYVIFEYQKQHKDQPVLKAQTFIENNFAQQVDMKDLAARVGMSMRNFKRRFRRATGDSPLCYLQRFRVEAAKRQFEDTHKSISEICYQIGYEDIAFFRRIFKRYVGIAPHDYRKRIQAR